MVSEVRMAVTPGVLKRSPWAAACRNCLETFHILVWDVIIQL